MEKKSWLWIKNVCASCMHAYPGSNSPKSEMGGTSYETRNFVQTHFTRIFHLKTTKKHSKILTKTSLSGPSPPKYSITFCHTIWYEAQGAHAAYMVKHHHMHMQRAHAHVC